MQPSEMTSLLYSRWQNRKECPNRFTNNRDAAKHYVVFERVSKGVSESIGNTQVIEKLSL